MRKNILLRTMISCLAITMGTMLWGCNTAETESSVPVTESTPTPAADLVSDNVLPEAPPEVETKLISITVINLSKAEVGMFSIIDPLLKEQADVGQVNAEGTLSFQCNWPVDEKELNWAVYDKQGELLLESTTDLTECKEVVSIMLSGEDTIDDVDTFFN